MANVTRNSSAVRSATSPVSNYNGAHAIHRCFAGSSASSSSKPPPSWLGRTPAEEKGKQPGEFASRDTVPELFSVLHSLQIVSMANSSFGSREGLTVRPAASSSSNEISLQIDPIDADLDDHIVGLRGQIRKLKGVAQEIQSEAKYQNDFVSQLQRTLTKAQAGVKNNMRRMNRRIIQNGSNHLVHVVLFAFGCFFLVYLVAKFYRR